jgi:hypothetical protein
MSGMILIWYSSQKPEPLAPTPQAPKSLSGIPEVEHRPMTTPQELDSKTVKSDRQNAGPLPAWVPLYPGAQEREGGMKTESSEGSAGTLFFTSKDSIEKVSRFYEQELKSQGFEVAASASAQAANITALRGESTTLNIEIHPEESLSVITLSFHGLNP